MKARTSGYCCAGNMSRRSTSAPMRQTSRVPQLLLVSTRDTGMFESKVWTLDESSPARRVTPTTQRQGTALSRMGGGPTFALKPSATAASVPRHPLQSPAFVACAQGLICGAPSAPPLSRVRNQAWRSSRLIVAECAAAPGHSPGEPRNASRLEDALLSLPQVRGAVAVAALVRVGVVELPFFRPTCRDRQRQPNPGRGPSRPQPAPRPRFRVEMTSTRATWWWTSARCGRLGTAGN